MGPYPKDTGQPQLYLRKPDGSYENISRYVSNMSIEVEYYDYDDSLIKSGIFSTQATYEVSFRIPEIEGLFEALVGDDEEPQGDAEELYEAIMDDLDEVEKGEVVVTKSDLGPVIRDPANYINPTGDFQGEAELVLEPVYALRVFNLYRDGLLHAINDGHGWWTAGTNESTHKSSMYGLYSGGYTINAYGQLVYDYGSLRHDFKANCNCGFWAYYNFDGDHIGDFLDKGCRDLRSTAFLDNNPRVLGVIKASGQVVMGEKGIRAQKAEIVALCAPGGMDRYDPRMRRMAENYPGVPIYFNADDMTAAHPLTEPPLGATVRQLPSRDIRKRGLAPLIHTPGQKPLIERIFKK